MSTTPVGRISYCTRTRSGLRQIMQTALHNKDCGTRPDVLLILFFTLPQTGLLAGRGCYTSILRFPVLAANARLKEWGRRVRMSAADCASVSETQRLNSADGSGRLSEISEECDYALPCLCQTDCGEVQ